MTIRSVLLRGFSIQKKYANVTSVLRYKYDSKHNYDSNNKYGSNNSKNSWNGEAKVAALLSSVVLAAAVAAPVDEKKHATKAESKSGCEKFEAGVRRSELPTFRAEEVSKHNTRDSFWVIYKNGVYDVTSFLPSHPGGEQIMNSAGLSIEPFWNVYGMHKTEDVYRLLETYRIGNLHVEDIVDHTDEELWAREPARDARLVVKTPKPFNAETPPKELVQNFDTPNELFYVRQHMPVPELDGRSHKVTVNVTLEGKLNKSYQFSLNTLDSRFERVSVRAALMCAGNRRSEMDKVKPVKGIDWMSGAISNAMWSGVLLRDVLIYCGVDTNDDMDGKHVILQGADIDATGQNFSTSIPLHMAMNPNIPIVLATHMNGVVLPPDHGYPLRVVVPGAPAVRSVKWLESITVSTAESPSHWHQKDYRSFNPSKTWETADFGTAPPVYSLPVTSAICDPVHGDSVTVKHGCVQVRGYAYSGGGAKILRVDVTADGGNTWIEATPIAYDSAPPGVHYAWTLWEASIPVGKGQKEMEIWAKATDSNFNTQPESFKDIWNIRGILSNAYHKIKVHIKY